MIAAGTETALPGGSSRSQQSRRPDPIALDATPIHREVPNDPWMPRPAGKTAGGIEHCGPWVRDGFVSVQVNVDANGCNIPGDAGNEPSIAVDPTDPQRMAIGWRQFDSVFSSFRQAGWGYSTDAGRTWTFPGSLTPGLFGSDPVLAADAHGVFYYLSIGQSELRLFRSFDAGAAWSILNDRIVYFPDKPWMDIDRTSGVARGTIYIVVASEDGYGSFLRSTDGGAAFSTPVVTGVSLGTVSVGPSSDVYLGDIRGGVLKSFNADDRSATPTFPLSSDVGFYTVPSYGDDSPNPGGLIGQSWVVASHPTGPCRGDVYFLGITNPPGDDPSDLTFAASRDGGRTWGDPVRINDDPVGNVAWQWFGTMSIAPNGRIDVVWNDTRNHPGGFVSELFYAFSLNGGVTWTANAPVSLSFDPQVGYPVQQKIGDYYHMASDDEGVNIAYAATFNGEQDIYFLRLLPTDCNGNGVNDAEDVATGNSLDCENDGIPDECETDCNRNGRVDGCDIADGVSIDEPPNGVPDECEPDLDGDGTEDGCDDDTDNDGIPNAADVCPFAPVGFPIVRSDYPEDLGRPMGDVSIYARDCMVDEEDYNFLAHYGCFSTGGPGMLPLSRACRALLGFVDFDADGDIDLEDFAGFQKAFARVGP